MLVNRNKDKQTYQKKDKPGKRLEQEQKNNKPYSCPEEQVPFPSSLSCKPKRKCCENGQINHQRQPDMGNKRSHLPDILSVQSSGNQQNGGTYYAAGYYRCRKKNQYDPSFCKRKRPCRNKNYRKHQKGQFYLKVVKGIGKIRCVKQAGYMQKINTQEKPDII